MVMVFHTEIIAQILGFLTGLQILFLVTIAILVFLAARILFKQVTKKFATELSAIVAIVVFYWLWTFFLGFIIASLAISGVVLLLFYVFGIPVSVLIAILLAVLDRK